MQSYKHLPSKVRHKAWAVAAVPMAVQVVMITVLFGILEQAEITLRRESELRSALAQVQLLSNLTVRGGMLAGSYGRSGGEVYKDGSIAVLKKARETVANLVESPAVDRHFSLRLGRLYGQIEADVEGLLESDNLASGLMQPRVKAEFREAGLILRELSQRLKGQFERIHKARFDIEALTRSVLLIWIPLNLLVALLTMWFFSCQIAERVKQIGHNAEDLAARRPLRTTVAGTDEIAELDAALWRVSKQLFSLDATKRERIELVKFIIERSLSEVQECLGKLSAGQWPQRAASRITMAQDGLERARRLIDQFLSIANVESAILQISRQDISVRQFLPKIIASLSGQLESAGVNVVWKSPDCCINADPDRLEELLLNLLTNAIKHSPRDGIVEVIVEESQQAWMISVRDKGPGMAQETVERLFQPFVQGEKPAEGGFGLGLLISRAIVEAHGGTIGVTSQVGQGSCFWFSLAHDGQTRTPGTQTPNAMKAPLLRSPGVWSKGVLAILLPLLPNIFVISFLLLSLNSVSTHLRMEDTAKRIIAAVSDLTTDSLDLLQLQISTGSRGIQFGDAHIDKLRARRDSSLDRLAALVRGSAPEEKLIGQITRTIYEADQAISSITRDFSGAELLAARNHMDAFGTAFRSAQRINNLLQELSDLQTSFLERHAGELYRLFRQVKLLLFSGVVVSIVMAVLSMYTLARSITDPLSRVYSNLLSLRDDLPIQEPMKGRDDIALLDQRFYLTACRLRELKSFTRYIVGVVSHEIRTPINLVQNVLVLLRTGVFGSIDSEQLSLVFGAESEAGELSRKLVLLLEIERFGQGNAGACKPQATSLFELCQDAIAFARSTGRLTSVDIDQGLHEVKTDLHTERLALALKAVLIAVLSERPSLVAIRIVCSAQSGHFKFVAYGQPADRAEGRSAVAFDEPSFWLGQVHELLDSCSVSVQRQVETSGLHTIDLQFYLN